SNPEAAPRPAATLVVPDWRTTSRAWSVCLPAEGGSLHAGPPIGRSAGPEPYRLHARGRAERRSVLREGRGPSPRGRDRCRIRHGHARTDGVQDREEVVVAVELGLARP